jgi:hypothetical protein
MLHSRMMSKEERGRRQCDEIDRAAARKHAWVGLKRS